MEEKFEKIAIEDKDRDAEFFMFLLNTVLELRHKCRRDGAFQTADRIRDRFQELGYGYYVRDKKLND